VVLDVRHPETYQPIAAHYLSLTPFRRLIRDYFRIRDSYYQAIKNSSPFQIEAVDMARRGMHDEAAELLRTRLANKLSMDLNTARRLFTLICAIQPYAAHAHAHESEEQLPAVLFVCSMNSVRSPIAAALARKFFPGRLIARSAGVRSGKADAFVHEVMEEIGIDMSVHTPHTMDELAATPFDLVVTLSPDARDAVDAGGLDLRRREHWPMPDPTLVEANREAILSAYRTLRDSLQMQVRERLEALVAGGSQTG
jgi:protein-tyrosine-phosphatase